MDIILGVKKYQTQKFDQNGQRIPVSFVDCSGCQVTQVIKLTDERTQIQMGIGFVKQIAKAQIGHLKKTGIDKKFRFFRSFSLKNDEIGDIKAGFLMNPFGIFTIGDKISVTGTSKGKGFAGVVKRHGFKGGPRTHGQSDRERAPGSIGQTTTPGRVYKGKRMAGRMGTDTVTVRGLKIDSVDESGLVGVRGLIPGPSGSLVVIKKS